MCERTVDYVNIYPTLCALTGLPVPEKLDGKSLVPLLHDPKSNWDRPAITTHGFKNHTVRTEGWRYIHYANGDEELYDEAADPLESVNLAGRSEHASRKAELAKWLPQIDAAELPSKGEGNAKKGKNRKAANDD